MTTLRARSRARRKALSHAKRAKLRGQAIGYFQSSALYAGIGALSVERAQGKRGPLVDLVRVSYEHWLFCTRSRGGT